MYLFETKSDSQLELRRLVTREDLVAIGFLIRCTLFFRTGESWPSLARRAKHFFEKPSILSFQEEYRKLRAEYPSFKALDYSREDIARIELLAGKHYMTEDTVTEMLKLERYIGGNNYARSIEDF